MSQYSNQSDTSIIDRVDFKEPPMYQVLIHNDDYTSMEFVVAILMQVFDKTEIEAERVMLRVHQSGIGVAGFYTYEIAETKAEFVHQLAQQNEFPLRCTLERE